MTSLIEIIENWLTTDPKLHHFRIIKLSYTWLLCDCIDHAWADYPSFQIVSDGVIVHTSWTKEHIYAADPNFFLTLYAKLHDECKVINANLN